MTLAESVWLLMPKLICGISTQTVQIYDTNSKVKIEKHEITAFVP